MYYRSIKSIEDGELLSMYFSNEVSAYSYFLFKHRLFNLLKVIKNPEVLELVENSVKNQKF